MNKLLSGLGQFRTTCGPLYSRKGQQKYPGQERPQEREREREGGREEGRERKREHLSFLGRYNRRTEYHSSFLVTTMFSLFHMRSVWKAGAGMGVSESSSCQLGYHLLTSIIGNQACWFWHGNWTLMVPNVEKHEKQSQLLSVCLSKDRVP